MARATGLDRFATYNTGMYVDYRSDLPVMRNTYSSNQPAALSSAERASPSPQTRSSWHGPKAYQYEQYEQETAQEWNGYLDGAVRSGHRAAHEVIAGTVAAFAGEAAGPAEYHPVTVGPAGATEPRFMAGSQHTHRKSPAAAGKVGS